MRKMMQRSLSCLLTLAMVVTMLMTSTLAAEKSAKLEFDYSANYESSKVVSLDVDQGYPADSYAKEEEIFSQLEAITPQADGSYVVTAPGTYAYHVHGTGYYNILQLFNVTEADLTAGVKKLSVIGGKLGGNGFEPTIKPEKAPASYKVDLRDSMLIFWPEEINKHFALEPQNYTTPAFDGKHAANEFTSQEELMAFLKKMDAASGTMHLYSAGTTPNYKYDLPLALFTTSEIPANATLAEAAKIVKGNGKLNVWYQAQIHPNEPAAGEGALVMIDNFVNDPTYKALLDKINIVIVPRINPGGSSHGSGASSAGFALSVGASAASCGVGVTVCTAAGTGALAGADAGCFAANCTPAAICSSSRAMRAPSAARSPESVSSQSFRMQSSASVRRFTLNWSCAAVSCKIVQSWMKRALVPCARRFRSVAAS